MRLRGYRSPLLLVALFCLFLKAINHLLKMTIISDTAKVVYSLLIKNGFDSEQAKLIVAQAAHETNNFSSRIFRENNNLFGMKVSSRKIATSEKNGHAVYSNISDSVKDYKAYYTARNYNKTYSSVDAFVQALKGKNYFEAPIDQYTKGMKHFYNLYYSQNA